MSSTADRASLERDSNPQPWFQPLTQANPPDSSCVAVLAVRRDVLERGNEISRKMRTAEKLDRCSEKNRKSSDRFENPVQPIKTFLFFLHLFKVIQRFLNL